MIKKYRYIIYLTVFILAIGGGFYVYTNNKNLWKRYHNQATALYKQQQYQPALELFNKALELNDKEPYVYNGKGGVLGVTGKYVEAIENYDKAIELDPNLYLPHQNKFCPLYNLKRYEEAVETCDRAIALEPSRHNIHEVYANKAIALNKLERYEEALKSAEKALELNAKDQAAIQAKAVAVSHLK